ncbi:MAG: type II toxin-antitoxin system Phd/YefM family antitoxin [Erysipelothrix sp.]|jgi:antitoxin YefM|nr:type II toxin-antitoxin system Phd/YefM family antitoxin [Erysipelothrix sp.]
MTLNLIKATNITTLRTHLKEKLEDVVEEKATLIVTRNNDQNVVIVSEDKFNEMIKLINNLEYELKLRRSFEQANGSEVIDVALEELDGYDVQ